GATLLPYPRGERCRWQDFAEFGEQLVNIVLVRVEPPQMVADETVGDFPVLVGQCAFVESLGEPGTPSNATPIGGDGLGNAGSDGVWIASFACGGQTGFELHIFDFFEPLGFRMTGCVERFPGFPTAKRLPVFGGNPSPVMVDFAPQNEMLSRSSTCHLPSAFCSRFL